jgi:hypothetical protein
MPGLGMEKGVFGLRNSPRNFAASVIAEIGTSDETLLSPQALNDFAAPQPIPSVGQTMKFPSSNYYTVSTLRLGAIQRGVRYFHQGLTGRTVIRKCGNTD